MKKGIFAILLLFALRSFAQTHVIDIKHWGVKDGLSNRLVTSICKDKMGFLWLGTPDGLNRFDGSKFTTFTEERDSLPFSNIGRIAADANGNIWLAGTPNEKEQLTIFDPVTHKCFLYKGLRPFLKDIYIDVLYAMKDSTIVVRTRNNTSDFLWHPRKGYRKMPLPAGHSMIGIMPEANVLITQNDSNELVITNMDMRLVRKIKAPFRKGSFAQWCTTAGLMITDVGTWNVYEITPDLEIRSVSKTFPVLQAVDRGKGFFSTNIEDVLWVDGKLYHPVEGMLRDLASNNGELEGHARAVLTDDIERGRLWVTNDFGLYLVKIARNKFRRYPSGYSDGRGKHGVNVNAYRTILCADSSLYCCNQGFGVYKINVRTGMSTVLVPARTKNIGYFALLQMSDGDLAGSNGVPDLFVADKTGKTKTYGVPAEPIESFWYFREYRPGLLLCGMENGLGWMKLPEGKFSLFTSYGEFAELAQALVLNISPDRQGRMWICCNKGFYRLDTVKGITERYSSSDTGTHYLPAKEFQHFYQDKDGIFWLATTKGLIRWDKEHNGVRAYTRADGLSNNNIYCVYEDERGRLWMSSDYGIMQFDKATGAVKTYLEEDGITYNEFNRVSHAQGKNGVLYFGSMDGITGFDPAKFGDTTIHEEIQASLAITSFKQFDDDRNLLLDRTAQLLNTHSVTLHPNDRFLTLEFALLNYSDPDQTIYYWKIDGVDKGWNTQKDRAIRLSRLPYGTRYLHIKAQAANGTWSANELTIELKVIPPLYLEPWFIAICILLFIALVIGIYYGRVLNYKRENLRLDRIVQEKTSDLQKKTDDLERSLDQKNVLLKEVHHRVKNNLQIISSLLQIQSRGVQDEMAKKALQEGKDRIMTMAAIHQSLYQKETMSALEIRSFTNDVIKQIGDLYGANEWPVTFENHVEETYLEIDKAVPLGLILNELLTNSFKHAFRHVKEPKIVIASNKVDNVLTITYRDNGPGLKEKMQISELTTLGMSLITGLTEQINGKIDYKYVEGACYTLRFHIK